MLKENKHDYNSQICLYYDHMSFPVSRYSLKIYPNIYTYIFFHPLKFYSLFYTQSFISFIDSSYFMVYIIEFSIYYCEKDEDCEHMCVSPGIPECFSDICFCLGKK